MNNETKLQQDKYFVLYDPSDGSVLMIDGAILLFSDNEAVESFINRKYSRTLLLHPVEYSWAELVKKYHKTAQQVVLDHTGDRGFYKVRSLK